MLQPEPLITMFHHVSRFPCVSLEFNLFNVEPICFLCVLVGLCLALFGFSSFVCVCARVSAFMIFCVDCWMDRLID